MKKFLTVFALLCLVATAVNARIIRIRVSDFQFSPNNVNAVVGDTVLWMWVSGTHTTTSVTIPAGARAWDAPINTNKRRFGYILKRAGTYNYRCTPHAAFMTGVLNVSAPLTAALENFAVANDNGKAVINWRVDKTSEIAYFSIQSSTDGKSFREIKRVLPSASTYSYADDNAKSKYTYYQVKITDNKGNTLYSDIQMHTRDIKLDKLITSLSPNPLPRAGHLMMQFNSDVDGVMRVQLYTQEGKLVKAADMSAAKGVNSGHFHMGELNPGTYYIVCTLGTRTEKHTILMK